MINFTISRALFFTGILTISLLTVGTANALPTNEVETVFYSDASKSEEVGFQLLSCDGGIYRTGNRTRFIDRYVSKCSVSTSLPETDLPCEFKEKGCGNLPTRRP